MHIALVESMMITKKMIASTKIIHFFFWWRNFEKLSELYIQVKNSPAPTFFPLNDEGRIYFKIFEVHTKQILYLTKTL